MTTDMVPAPTTEQLSWRRVAALHLIPGALVTLTFVALAPVMKAVGLPPAAALLAAIAVVLIPLELGIIVRTAQRHGATAALPYRRPFRRRAWLWLVPTLIAAALIGFGAHMPIEAWLIDRYFNWLPGWFVTPIPLDHVSDYSTRAWWVTLGAYLVLNGVAGPVVEELYFRGYLLPRMNQLGRWAPLINVTLFSLYHFWSPWQLVARILALTPMAYAVRWKRNIYLGMITHCTLNTLGILLVTRLVMTRL